MGAQEVGVTLLSSVVTFQLVGGALHEPRLGRGSLEMPFEDDLTKADAFQRYQNEVQTSENFSTAGRTVKSGLVAAAVVSSW